MKYYLGHYNSESLPTVSYILKENLVGDVMILRHLSAWADISSRINDLRCSESHFLLRITKEEANVFKENLR